MFYSHKKLSKTLLLAKFIFSKAQCEHFLQLSSFLNLKNIKWTLILFCFFVVIFYSCSDNALYEKNQNIPHKTWDRKNILQFKVNITDTLNPYKIFINIRNNGLYARRNLYMFITVISPKGNELRDTVNCILADEKGKWYGKSNLGDLYFNKFLYKSNVLFPYSGTYTFKLEQAMRTEKLEHIEDVGIRIEPLK
ncbi:MAG: gliding motility lipoprotein GldH [Bacteroidales bacterium]|nr:gliding motility lipoprotein GldH [Bacteroidales bacterium]